MGSRGSFQAILGGVPPPQTPPDTVKGLLPLYDSPLRPQGPRFQFCFVCTPLRSLRSLHYVHTKHHCASGCPKKREIASTGSQNAGIIPAPLNTDTDVREAQNTRSFSNSLNRTLGEEVKGVILLIDHRSRSPPPFQRSEQLQWLSSLSFCSRKKSGVILLALLQVSDVTMAILCHASKNPKE